MLGICATFQFDSSTSTWKVDGTGHSLSRFCTDNDCCGSTNFNGSVNLNSECTEWNEALPYTICGGSCQGTQACAGIAKNASGGSSVKINSGGCKGGTSACYKIGQYGGNVEIEIGSGACANVDYACFAIGITAQSLTRIEVPANECLDTTTFTDSNGNSGTVGKCFSCGDSSTLTGTLVATDEACNYTPPQEEQEEPTNPCNNINCSNRGKCQVLSLTEAECKCENTFIPSENKLDCICPSNHEFNADVNRCFPITEAPSKSPTISPTKTSSASPSQVATTTDEDVCEDDETATFKLIKVDKDVPCSWITKNKKKRAIRKERYCGLDEVKAICPATCGLCPE